MTENQEHKPNELLRKLLIEQIQSLLAAQHERNNTSSKRFFERLGYYMLLSLKIAGLIFVGTASLRLAYAEFNFSFLQNFSFSELLSLILALFAMLMSILFYFKSTESSNKFYSDTYKFTKDISESIGRIDERFGERLRHLDESYGRMEKRIYDGYVRDVKKEEIEEKKENADNELKQANEKYEEKINALLENAKINNAEKEKLKNELEKLQRDRENAAMEVHRLQRRIQRMESEATPGQNVKLIHALRNYIPNEMFDGAKLSRMRWQKIAADLPEQLVRDLRISGCIDGDNDLTPYGYELLTSSRKRMI